MWPFPPLLKRDKSMVFNGNKKLSSDLYTFLVLKESQTPEFEETFDESNEKQVIHTLLHDFGKLFSLIQQYNNIRSGKKGFPLALNGTSVTESVSFAKHVNRRKFDR